MVEVGALAVAAAETLRAQAALPRLYYTYSRLWERLGYPAFVAMLVVFWLMVAKPSFWS